MEAKVQMSRLGVSTCLRPSDLISEEKTTANKKNGSQKPKPGCAGIWCSAEKQHNEVQITRRQISQEIAGGNMHNASW